MMTFPNTHMGIENCDSEALVLLIHNEIKLLHWTKYD